MPNKVWDEIIYPSPNSNNCTVEVEKWIRNLQFIVDVITCPVSPYIMC